MRLTKVQKGLLLSTIILILGYLSGSFINVSFNIKSWGEESRTIIVSISWLLALFVTGTFLDVVNQEDNNKHTDDTKKKN